MMTMMTLNILILLTQLYDDDDEYDDDDGDYNNDDDTMMTLMLGIFLPVDLSPVDASTRSVLSQVPRVHIPSEYEYKYEYG